MAGYVNSGAVDTDVDVDTSRVKGLTAVVTGGMVNHSYSSLMSLMLTESQGANGIGEAYTRALVQAG